MSITTRQSTAQTKSVTVNTLFLAVSNGLLIVTALAFWAVAKRIMPTIEYNRGLVLINAIMLIGSIAGLNGHISLPAAIARRGSKATGLVTRSLIIAASLAAVGGLIYHIASTMVVEWPEVWKGWIIMPLACAGWLVFALQDGILVGVGHSELVPTENLIYGIARLGLLVVTISLYDGSTAMAVAWVGPLLIAIPAVLGYVYGIALPKAKGDSSADEAYLDRRIIQADAAGSFFSQALFRLVPLAAIVVIADDSLVAALNTGWLVFATSDFLLSTIGTSLSIANPADREASARDAARLAGAVGGAMAIGLIIFAPLIMKILLDDIGHLAVPLVRLIGVALFFRSPLHLVVAEARMLGKARMLFMVQMVSGVIMIVALALSLATANLTMVGLALAGSSIIVLPGLWVAMRRIRADLPVS